MINIQDIFNYLPSASTADLNAILCAVKEELPKRKEDLSDLVDFAPDFCPDGKLLARVWDECQSLVLSPNRNKAPTQWIKVNSKPVWNEML